MKTQFLKYLLVGAFVVAVNLSVLYSLTEFAHVFYLLSAICAFFVSFIVSFILQKYWTFKGATHHSAHKQAIFYLVVQICNVSLNTAFLYVFVTYLHIWYIASQVFISLVLAVAIFAVNRLFIFKQAA